MNCEMCGKQGPLVQALIEGVQMQVCKACATMGKVLSLPAQEAVRMAAKPGAAVARPAKAAKEEPVLRIVDDAADRIRAAREKLGLNQEEFAARLRQKASFLRNLESGAARPSIELAQTLEKELHIRLVEEEDASSVVLAKQGSGGMTLGDIWQKSRKTRR